MRNLFVLHDQPRLGVQLLADVHLRPTLMVSCKLIHSAVMHTAPGEVTETKSMDGVTQFKYNGILLMPPYPGPNPWVDWASSNFHHFWWLVEMSWWADKELQHRFHLPQDLLYLRTNKIIEEGACRHFPKPDRKGVGNWPCSQLIVGDEIMTHRQIYKTMKGKVRLKWTNRETPAFMVGDQLVQKPESLCPDCGAPAPEGGRICDINCYYGRN